MVRIIGLCGTDLTRISLKSSLNNYDHHYQDQNPNIIINYSPMLSRTIATVRRALSIYQTITVEDGKMSKFESRNFADQIRITLVAGAGGNGCISYYTDKTVRKGQPDGGHGGKGGDIILEAHKSVYDLSNFRRRRIIQGNDGGCGGPRGKDGKNGGKTIMRVPCGTSIYEIQVNENQQTMEKTEKKNFLVDLEHHEAKFLAVKGGEMGKGNQKSPFMSEQHKFGKQGQKKILYLELKTLADAGLVGFPNIGKSTFLAAVSRALPKIANYQFTTLKPSVGYVKFVDEFKMTFADIPGIVEGAHKNKGLGIQFLRHIQRTKVLIFVLDITSDDPVQQFKKLQVELSQYAKQKFANKNKIVLFNKSDCLKNSKEVFQTYKSKIPYPSFLISAKEGDGIGQALLQIRKIVQKQREKQSQQQKEPIIKQI